MYQRLSRLPSLSAKTPERNTPIAPPTPIISASQVPNSPVGIWCVLIINDAIQFELLYPAKAFIAAPSAININDGRLSSSLNTLSIEGFSPAEARFSVRPRMGSGTVSLSTMAIKTPGTPPTKKATRQPKNSFSQPPNKKPNKIPMLIPVE